MHADIVDNENGMIGHACIDATPSSMFGISRIEYAASETKHRKRSVSGTQELGSWKVRLIRQGRRIKRFFPDALYGSRDGALAEAKAYHDAILAALPPAARTRKDAEADEFETTAGIIRTFKLGSPCWQAAIREVRDSKIRLKTKVFSVNRHGEEDDVPRGGVSG
ncbi:MAG: hypothetical protein QM636_09645 [Rhizobium sp.]